MKERGGGLDRFSETVVSVGTGVFALFERKAQIARAFCRSEASTAGHIHQINNKQTIAFNDRLPHLRRSTSRTPRTAASAYESTVVCQERSSRKVVLAPNGDCCRFFHLGAVFGTTHCWKNAYNWLPPPEFPSGNWEAALPPLPGGAPQAARECPENQVPLDAAHVARLEVLLAQRIEAGENLIQIRSEVVFH